MHLGLLSLCPRPAGLPSGQGLSWDSRTHSIPVPALWTDGVLPTAASLQHALLFQQSQISVQGLQAHRNGVSAFPHALPMEDKTFGSLKEKGKT